MTIDVDKLLNWPFEQVEHAYTTRDTALYALGVGLGMDPVNEAELRFLYEKNMLALPTMAVVIGYPGTWASDPDSGIDYLKVLHGEQGIRVHKPLPAAATVTGLSRVTGVVDKGEGKGALIYVEREVKDKASGEKLCTLSSTIFARGDGGFGGPDGPTKDVHTLPKREPDLVCDLPTLPQAALIYRLSGDWNPLHVDPKVAKKAGFEKPILHGLGTLGVAGHAILKTCCDYDPARLKSLDLRFSAPVYPGETIRTEIWRDGEIVSFRARVIERDVVVLNNGRVEVSA